MGVCIASGVFCKLEWATCCSRVSALGNLWSDQLCGVCKLTSVILGLVTALHHGASRPFTVEHKDRGTFDEVR